MRPQTAKARNCIFYIKLDFIKDQEQATKPGPGTY